MVRAAETTTACQSPRCIRTPVSHFFVAFLIRSAKCPKRQGTWFLTPIQSIVAPPHGKGPLYQGHLRLGLQGLAAVCS
jgi:hypothetical protein